MQLCKESKSSAASLWLAVINLFQVLTVFKSVWPSVCLHVQIGAISLLLNKYYTRRSGNMPRSPRKHRHMNTGIALKRWLLCRRPPPNFSTSPRIHKNAIVRIYFLARRGCLPRSIGRFGQIGSLTSNFWKAYGWKRGTWGNCWTHGLFW